MASLPKKPLTNIDLLRYVKKFKIPHFRGVFMKNTLPKKIYKIECGIVNLEEDFKTGSHWTAYIKYNDDISYFDSYGNLPPPPQLINYFGSDKSIKYNYNRYQKFNSVNCGHLCLDFLYRHSTN